MIRDMGVNKKRWLTYELGKTKTKHVIKVYVKMLMSGRIDWDQLGQMYRPDQKEPVWTLKRLLKQEETQKMITEEMDKLLASEGITPTYVIQKRKELLEKGFEKGDLTNINRASDSFQGMLDMQPKEAKFTAQVDYVALLDKEKKSLPPGEVKN